MHMMLVKAEPIKTLLIVKGISALPDLLPVVAELGAAVPIKLNILTYVNKLFLNKLKTPGTDPGFYNLVSYFLLNQPQTDKDECHSH